AKAEKDREELEKFLATPWSHQAKYDKLVEEQKGLVTALGGNKGDDATLAVGEGGEVKDDSVAAAEPEGDEEEAQPAEAEEGMEAAPAESVPTEVEEPQDKTSGPISAYKRGRHQLQKDGWFTADVDGRQMYSDGEFLLEGKPPGKAVENSISADSFKKVMTPNSETTSIRP